MSLTVSFEEIYLPVQRIIPFSNVEGIGNRTSIFLQGCNINCLYCHNPETIALTSNTAKYMSLVQLLQEVKASMPFIRGITVSGGEPTIYAKELAIFFREVHKLGLTCYIDSNGFFDYEAILPLIEQTDKFLFDVKGTGSGLKELCFSQTFITPEKLDFDFKKQQHEKIKELLKEVVTRPEAENLTIKTSDNILERNMVNLQKLLQLGKVEEVRLVYIKGFYEEKQTVRKIAEALKDYPEVLFKLIRVHGKGARSPKKVSENMPSRQDATELAEYAKSLGLSKQVLIL